jgi:hypothetical protein
MRIWLGVLFYPHSDEEQVATDVDATDAALDHTYHNQIMLDVRRAFHFDRCKNWSSRQRENMANILGVSLHTTFLGFDAREDVHYFQVIGSLGNVPQDCSYNL